MDGKQNPLDPQEERSQAINVSRVQATSAHKDSCFDSLVQKRLKLRVPKDISFIKPDPQTEFKGPQTEIDLEEEALRKHLKKLGQSNVEVMISKTK